MKFVGIDPSTKTGFVALNEDASILAAEEITARTTKDPERMIEIIDKVMNHIEPDDVVCIEGFAYGAKGNAVGILYGIGWGIRMAFFYKGIPYIEVTPGQLKKYASSKGTTKKDELAVCIFERWGFKHSSDNVRDAFVLAQIAHKLYKTKINQAAKVTKFQAEIIQQLLKQAS